MYFDERYGNRKQRIPNCDACVRKRAGIEYDEIDAVGCCLLHTVDQFMFRVALKAFQRVAKFIGDVDTICFDVIEASRAVNLWLSRAQQVEIRTIEQQEVGHFASSSTSFPEDGGNSNLICGHSCNFCGQFAYKVTLKLAD